ncbi:hypothetical protein [Halorhodospira halophila]|uniref:Permease n=1 Tax=Halorhodospira halophila (strain DSM 244 / SL1) TaxID=349124 RepID=A1WX41_HALHL|nr:hypothetical protein [Halorhodospira halophila]ABM62253.1 hypothetical protein Hhal_1486 [Halorhodospira halophila SL1]MBK1729228.1 hypothetical protein [Halorhodospira halophila]
MLTAFLIILALLAASVLLAHFLPHASHRAAVQEGGRQLRPLLARLPAALLAAAFLAVLIPEQAIASLFGTGSGWLGVLLASVLGGFLPGGPVVAFPLVVVLLEAGADTPQLIALLTAWSVLAFHRVAAFELPMLGGRATGVRLLASLPLPVIAGAGAGGVVQGLGAW